MILICACRKHKQKHKKTGIERSIREIRINNTYKSDPTMLEVYKFKSIINPERESKKT